MIRSWIAKIGFWVGTRNHQSLVALGIRIVTTSPPTQFKWGQLISRDTSRGLRLWLTDEYPIWGLRCNELWPTRRIQAPALTKYGKLHLSLYFLHLASASTPRDLVQGSEPMGKSQEFLHLMLCLCNPEDLGQSFSELNSQSLERTYDSMAAMRFSLYPSTPLPSHPQLQIWIELMSHFWNTCDCAVILKSHHLKMI